MHGQVESREVVTSVKREMTEGRGMRAFSKECDPTSRRECCRHGKTIPFLARKSKQRMEME